MMQSKVRATIIVLCALLGGVLSFAFMPDLLNSVFKSVSTSGGKNSGVITNPNKTFTRQREFDVLSVPIRANFKLNSEDQAKWREKLNIARREIGANFDEFHVRGVAEQMGLTYQFAVSLTEEKMASERYYAPLRTLSPGQISAPLVSETMAAIYLFREERVVSLANSVADDSGEQQSYSAARSPFTLGGLILLGLIVGGVLGDLAMRMGSGGMRAWQKMAVGDRVTLFLGCVAGIIGSLPFMFVFQGMGQFGPLLVMGLMILFSALGVYALRSMEEVLPWGGLTTNRKRSGLKILDTNVLIDGRIYDIAKAGFVEGEFYVPAFVLQELQYIADSADPLRRQRGRRGLSMLRNLQSEFNLEVGTRDRHSGDKSEPVDNRLVKLANSLGADLVSNDFNLNNVANLQGVRVLNINDLALAVRTNLLPGETMTVHLIREGQQPKQAVAYLEDGTMVVVERSVHVLGTDQEVNVTQVIQTERGKMIFAELVSEDNEKKNK